MASVRTLSPRVFYLVGMACLMVSGGAAPRNPTANEGRLELTVTDKQTGKPIACRMHLKNASGRPRLVRDTPFWDDHFVVPGQLALVLPLGNYTFEMERGPEYRVVTGHFTINRNADDGKQVEMVRGVDMAAAGWYSGDLDVQRRARDIELVMNSEDLHVVPLTTWTSAQRVDERLAATSDAGGPT